MPPPFLVMMKILQKRDGTEFSINPGAIVDAFKQTDGSGDFILMTYDKLGVAEIVQLIYPNLQEYHTAINAVF